MLYIPVPPTYITISLHTTDLCYGTHSPWYYHEPKMSWRASLFVRSENCSSAYTQHDSLSLNHSMRERESTTSLKRWTIYLCIQINEFMKFLVSNIEWKECEVMCFHYQLVYTHIHISHHCKIMLFVCKSFAKLNTKFLRYEIIKGLCTYIRGINDNVWYTYKCLYSDSIFTSYIQ